MSLMLDALILLLVLYSLFKLRRAHLLLYDMRDQSRQDNVQMFRQLEALQGLYAELDLGASLPATRDWAASPDFLLALTRHARAKQPSLVVECSSGASTLVLARCMQLNGAGKVLSLEHDPHYAAQTRAQLRQHGLQDWAQVLDAPLKPLMLTGESWPWYDSSALPPDASIDMLVIDGPPQATREMARYPAGPMLFERLAPCAYVFVDDANRIDELEILRRWKQAYPALHQSTLACEKGCAVLINGG
ncbi:class I SAM-dependent methyltransferase [Duganella sp. sic0402]|uniref:class I SAM-dependent methyltransferase n=1 Tax=Duganella sp. sic0402 TaxID=2854786 RepID=UPI001C46FA0C|nr:class I SAM-dependent methyltransferase [Duganella sp. sic0402]MBV7534765.1 class I SAM-dependent methyltransferase [Duganella sp. sic0402]